jgi:hypothetical protein
MPTARLVVRRALRARRDAVLLGGLLVVTALQGCDLEPRLAALLPGIAVSPTRIDFGFVKVARPAATTLTLSNNGNGTLHVSGIDVHPADSGLVVAADAVPVEPSTPIGTSPDARAVVISPAELNWRQSIV